MAQASLSVFVTYNLEVDYTLHATPSLHSLYDCEF